MKKIVTPLVAALLAFAAAATYSRAESLFGRGTIGPNAAISTCTGSTCTITGGITATPGPVNVGLQGIKTDGGVTFANQTDPNVSDWTIIKVGDDLAFRRTDGTVYFNIGYASAVLSTAYSFQATGYYQSIIATGNNAFAIFTNGARMDFGSGASDYATSDGTSVTFAGPVTSASAATAGVATLGTTAADGGAVSATATVSVIAGTHCTCQDQNDTALAITRCNVTNTTLTIKEAAGTNVIGYHCF